MIRLLTLLSLLPIALFAMTAQAEDVPWLPAFGADQGQWTGSGAGKWAATGDAAQGKAPAKGAALLASSGSFQNVALEGEYRCKGVCKGGILLRARRDGDRISGIYVSFDTGDLRVYSATFDKDGREISRAALPPRGPSPSGAANPTVPGPTPEAKNISFPPEFPGPTANLHAELRKGEWNAFSLFLSRDAVEVVVNQIRLLAGNANATGNLYGSVLLHMAGPGQVEFRNLRIKDLQDRRTLAPDTVGPGFRKLQLNDLYFGDHGRGWRHQSRRKARSGLRPLLV